MPAIFIYKLINANLVNVLKYTQTLYSVQHFFTNIFINLLQFKNIIYYENISIIRIRK